MWRTKGMRALLSSFALCAALGVAEVSAQETVLGRDVERPAPLNFAFDFSTSISLAERLKRPGIQFGNRDRDPTAPLPGYEMFNLSNASDYLDKGYGQSGEGQRDINEIKAEASLEILAETSAKGGLAGAIADLGIEALEITRACGSYTAPVVSSIYYHINDYKDEAIFDIRTVKAIPAGCADAGDTVKRRWVVAVVDNGLRNGPIDFKKGDVEFKHKYYARGKRIRVIAFYENGVLVKDFLPNGDPDPRAKVYWQVDNACIDFKFQNDLVSLSREGTLNSSASNIIFCAGGCAIPGILATM